MIAASLQISDEPLILLSDKSFSNDENKAETLLLDFSLFCYFACSYTNAGNMSKSTYFTGQQ